MSEPMSFSDTEQKIDMGSLTLTELSDALKLLAERYGMKIPSFRAKQIFSRITSGIVRFEDMTELPKELREHLDKAAYIATPAVQRKLVSALDGTVKYLFRLHDGECVESVFMRYHHGNTLCISSQVG